MPHSPFTILMADDDLEDLELVEIAITKIDPNAGVYKVHNGRAALDYLTNQPDNNLPCLIILDYNMPELTGLDVLSQICKDRKFENIPKVIFSTSSSPMHIKECINNGAIEYLVKPNNMSGFYEVAKKMLSYCKGN